LQERRRGHSAINALDQDSGPYGLRHRPEFRLLLAGLTVTADLACKSRRQPGTHFRRHGIGPHFRQIVIFFRRPSVIYLGDYNNNKKMSRNQITIMNTN
jgi:hypothetical protein